MPLLKSLPSVPGITLRLVAAPLALAILAAAPAKASEAPLGKIVAELNDPQRQEALAGAVEALGTALLDVKVAPFLQAMDRAGLPSRRRTIDPDATLADLAGPEAREMPRELAGRLPALIGMMGAMGGELETMLPQLEAMGKRLEQSMDDAVRRDSRRRN